MRGNASRDIFVDVEVDGVGSWGDWLYSLKVDAGVGFGVTGGSGEV